MKSNNSGNAGFATGARRNYAQGDYVRETTKSYQWRIRDGQREFGTEQTIIMREQGDRKRIDEVR